ncbi:DNA alkylation repair protein [Thermomonospora umbrina]|uniref:3-methyladenine DNA glycosylase AlkD n=1 Tax=Thermomonospora umbrina TaxID=111806 RepID=A0A3D9T0I0_9ACTN|nr:DNA alkylation repair protein [Thermomonospora umbrina]REE98304.1 3-methyladenine DNA glycosylase AlkD [Thermomonospora umbrina]
MDVAEVAREVEASLRSLGGPERAMQEKRYLKSDLVHLGVPVPAIRKVALAAVRSRVERAEVLALAERLWTASSDGVPVHELRMAAVEVLVKRAPSLEPEDLALAERFLRESSSWVYVDALADRVVGDMVLRRPQTAATLDAWVHDPVLWIRRSALLALLRGIRAGRPDLARISRYGDVLLGEREFFIRKALGWVLRELSKRDPDWVAAWVDERAERLSGVTLREATRHLPRPAAR